MYFDLVFHLPQFLPDPPYPLSFVFSPIFKKQANTRNKNKMPRNTP